MARSTTTTTTKYTNLIIISRFLTVEPIESPSLPLQGIDDFSTLSSSWSSTGSAMLRPWVGAVSFRAASTPSSLKSTTSSIGSTALSSTTTLHLLLFPLWLSPPPSASLATRSRTSSDSCLAKSSSPFSSLPNSLTLWSPYDVIPRIFCFSSTIARWVDMEGDLVFALWLLDWIWVLGFCCCCWDDIFERRERERGVVGVVTFEIWVLFFWVSLSEGKKVCICGCFFLSFLDLELCSWFFFFSFIYLFIYLWVCVLGSEFVFLLFLFKTHLHLNSYDF